MSKGAIFGIILVVVLGVGGWVLVLQKGGVVNVTAGGRVKELNEMPAMYESVILQANPKDPNTEGLLIVFADVVNNLLSRERTSDYIPESVQALAARNIPNDDDSAEPTIAIGDTVEVLQVKESKRKEMFYLVRTRHGTYGWIAPFHLNDENGNRLATFR